MQFINSNLLTDVLESETFLYSKCNAITTSTTPKGKYGSINCWLNQEVISNIFSINVLNNLGLRITYDSNYDNWCVSKDGSVFSQTAHKSYKGYTKKQVNR